MFIVNCGIEARISQAVTFALDPSGLLPLGSCRFRLVFLAVLSGHLAPPQRTPTEVMALVHAMFIFVAVCTFLLAAASLGNLILRVLHLEIDTDAQHLLICAGVGVISIEMLFGVAIT